MLDKFLNRILPGDTVAVNGIVWNVISFGIIGISGILLNIVISSGGGELLGAFNQVMAIYIILGQFGALGLQNAAIYYMAKYHDDKEKKETLFTTYFIISISTGFLVSLVCYMLSPVFGRQVFKSELVYMGLRVLAPAIFLFSINKVFLGIINGLRIMRAFAVLQATRYIMLITFSLGAILFCENKSRIMYAFVFAEIAVFFPSLFILLRHIKFGRLDFVFLKESINMGIKFMAGGIIGEANTKLDIIVLGFFCSDEKVGVYAMASTLAEGFFSLITVIRSNINPLFAKLLLADEKEKLGQLLKDIRKKAVFFSLGGAVGITIVYYAICVLKGQEYYEALIPLAYILACMVIASPAIIKGNLLGQKGRPELDTFITLSMVLLNLVCNIAFIPKWELMGAAFATGNSYLLLIICQDLYIRKVIWGKK